MFIILNIANSSEKSVNGIDWFLQDLRKQRATGKTKDGACFPLSLSVKLASEVDSSRPISTGLWRNLFIFYPNWCCYIPDTLQ